METTHGTPQGPQEKDQGAGSGGSPMRQGAANDKLAPMTAPAPIAPDEVNAMTTQQATAPRELAARSNDGIDVVLLWHPARDAVTVAVDDARTGESFELAVEHDR